MTNNGTELRLLRRMASWRLGDLAGELGITLGYLSMLECGHCPISDELMARARAVLIPAATKHVNAVYRRELAIAS